MALLLSSLVFIVVAILFLISPWLLSTHIKLLIDIAVPFGVMVALISLILSERNRRKEFSEKESHFYLDSCIVAYEKARELIIDGNNDRATWVAAGRALIHAKELASLINIDAHKRVLELHELMYRGVFHDILSGKPDSFFYGIPNYKNLSLDDAAKASTAPEERNGLNLSSSLKELPEKSIYTVWQAAQWPQGYKEPLSQTFSTQERESLWGSFSGLENYLKHKEKYHSASGRLFPKNDQNLKQY